MGKFALTNGMTGLVIGGAAAVGAIVVGLYVSGALFPSSDPTTESSPEAPVAAETATAPVPAPSPNVAETEQDGGEAETTAETEVVAEPDAPAGTEVAEDASAAEGEPQIVPEDVAATPEEATSDVPEPVAEVPEEATPDAPEPVAPAFDVVRVSPDGQTLVAGTAPGARDILVLVDGVEAGSASVDGAGKFVAFLDLPFSDQPRVVSLVSDGDLGTTESNDQVIIAPTVRVAAVDAPVQEEAVAPIDVDQGEQSASVQPVEPVAETAKPADAAVAEDPVQTTEPADTTSVAVTEAEPDATSVEPSDAAPSAVATLDATTSTPQSLPTVPVEVATAETGVAALPDAPSTLAAPALPEAPAVILSTEAGVEVLQPSGSAPQALDQIALDAITYESAGAVALSGRGNVDEYVRVYLNNEPIATTEITADGRWRADLPEVDSGTYTLRVDAVDTTGAVVSRVESPFLREDPVALAQAVERGNASSVVQVVTVQPGNTLWAIARDRYGEGLAYVRVFDANRDRIRNPDLIYPGQVFSIPN